MRRTLVAGAIVCAVVSMWTGFSSGVVNPDGAASIPRAMKTLILNTLDGTILKIKDVQVYVQKGRNHSTAQSWDYQGPDRAETIPRRVLLSHRHYGLQIEVGNIVVDHFSEGQLDPGSGFKLIPVPPPIVGLRNSREADHWTNVQSQFLAPLIKSNGA